MGHLTQNKNALSSFITPNHQALPIHRKFSYSILLLAAHVLTPTLSILCNPMTTSKHHNAPAKLIVPKLPAILPDPFRHLSLSSSALSPRHNSHPPPSSPAAHSATPRTPPANRAYQGLSARSASAALSVLPAWVYKTIQRRVQSKDRVGSW